MFYWEQALGQTQDSLERLSLGWLRNTSMYLPDELEEVTREKEVKASLVRLLPP